MCMNVLHAVIGEILAGEGEEGAHGLQVPAEVQLTQQIPVSLRCA